MSKIGKKPIPIPGNITINISKEKISVKGLKGKLEKKIPSEISIERGDNEVLVRFHGERERKVLWGSWRAHIKNMIEGVTQGFEKRLKIEGIGWKANLDGKDLVLRIGLTHPVKISPPGDISFSIEKEVIKISGIDKEKVGSIAAKIRAVQPPEPYKGKGIRYADEVVRRKAGKKAATTME